MNEIFCASESEQQRWLDRLIDGELTQDQQRQLILSLETRPDGWRRCAMAFLESQTWRQEFQEIANNCQPISPLVTESAVVANRISRPLHPLAIAAGLILAFAIGFASQIMLSTNLAHQSIASGNIAETQTAEESQVTKRETLKVTIPSSNGESEETLELPLIEGDENALASLLTENRPVLSEMALKTLKSTGHQVEQHRAYYPVQLDDGRQAVLPMDLVEVKYTGGWQ